MKVILNTTLKGSKLWIKGEVFDTAKTSLPSEIQRLVTAKSPLIQIIPDVQAPVMKEVKVEVPVTTPADIDKQVRDGLLKALTPEEEKPKEMNVKPETVVPPVTLEPKPDLSKEKLTKKSITKRNLKVK